MSITKIQETILNHLAGRKFAAFLVTSLLIVLGGVLPQTQPVITTVATSLVAALGIFVTGHTATDIKANATNTPDTKDAA